MILLAMLRAFFLMIVALKAYPHYAIGTADSSCCKTLVTSTELNGSVHTM